MEHVPPGTPGSATEVSILTLRRGAPGSSSARVQHPASSIEPAAMSVLDAAFRTETLAGSRSSTPEAAGSQLDPSPMDPNPGADQCPVSASEPDPPVITPEAAATALCEYFLANAAREDNAANDDLVAELVNRMRTRRQSGDSGPCPPLPCYSNDLTPAGDTGHELAVPSLSKPRTAPPAKPRLPVRTPGAHLHPCLRRPLIAERDAAPGGD